MATEGVPVRGNKTSGYGFDSHMLQHGTNLHLRTIPSLWGGLRPPMGPVTTAMGLATTALGLAGVYVLIDWVQRPCRGIVPVGSGEDMTLSSAGEMG